MKLLTQIIVFGLSLIWLTAINAKIIHVSEGENLQTVINNSQAGDELIVAGAEFIGNIVIDKPLTLRGANTITAKTIPQQPLLSVIVGDRKGNTIIVKASDVTITQLTIRHSGLDLSAQDSGVFVDKDLENVVITQNYIEDNLIGVYLWGSLGSVVSYNRIIGQKDMHVNDRGNGVQIWNSPHSLVEYNYISHGRDGIFTTTSKNNSFSYNYFDNLRYSVHYMYTLDSTVSYNYSKDNGIGYALMFSSGLDVHDNISIADKEHGIFSNFLNKSEIYDNVVIGPTEKCLMLYNANYNTIYDNYFEGCHIGIHFTAGSQDNVIYSNAFIENYKQVKYVGTTYLEWSKDNKGNFWSNHNAFDLDANGIADVVFRPNAIVDEILWTNSNTQVLFNSPAVQMLSWAQSHFPSLLPGGIQDSYPLTSIAKPIDFEHILNKKPYD